MDDIEKLLEACNAFKEPNHAKLKIIGLEMKIVVCSFPGSL